MHNLYFSDEHLPRHLDFEHAVVALARIKAQVAQYIRQNNCHQSIIGFKFNIPEVTLEDIRHYFDR
jgi:hypothetical protein